VFNGISAHDEHFTPQNVIYIRALLREDIYPVQVTRSADNSSVDFVSAYQEVRSSPKDAKVLLQDLSLRFIQRKRVND
jgi:hypothetical protein